MTCSLLDIGCHLQSSAWEWWAEIGLLNKVLIVGGLVGIILGISWGFLTLIKRIGGWPAVIGFMLAVLGLVLALLPEKPKGKDDVTGTVVAAGKARPFQFGVEKKKSGKRSRSVFDMLRKRS